MDFSNVLCYNILVCVYPAAVGRRSTQCGKSKRKKHIEEVLKSYEKEIDYG